MIEIREEWLLKEFAHALHIYHLSTMSQSFMVGRCSALASVYDEAQDNNILHKIIHQVQNRSFIIANT